MNERANEPAYPVNERDVSRGLTIREYFAGLAMQGLLACPSDHDYGSWDAARSAIADAAVAHADALIDAINQEQVK